MAKLGEMLLKEGLLTPEQLETALKSREPGPLGHKLLQRGLIDEAQLVEVLCRQSGYPKFERDPQSVDAALAKIVTAEVAGKYSCAPVILTGNLLSIALLDPENDKVVNALGQLTGKTIKAMVIGESALKLVWQRLYNKVDLFAGAASGETAPKGAEQAPAPIADEPGIEIDPNARYDLTEEEASKVVNESGAQIPDEGKKIRESVPVLGIAPSDPPLIQCVFGLIMEALNGRASDIHIEPYPTCVRVRYRVDGELHTGHDLPPHLASGVVSRLKVLAGLDIAEKRFPQDGRVKLAMPGKGNIDFRMSTLPCVYGEKVVMRVLGTGQLRNSVEELGFRGKTGQWVRDAIRNPYGMILVTGPTGSGKTTTLYTMLKELSEPEVNIVTAEDPVEYNLPNITQVSVRPGIGFTFDVALRSFLRQDPDIILVGEMRDFETASIAIKAALTGHLVFSTVHTNDAPSTVVRLIDMGIEPFLVASAVKLVMAQRLIRRICTKCKAESPVPPEIQAILDEQTISRVEKHFSGKGCPNCNKSGFRGRVPVYEVMPIKSKDLKRVITEGGTEVMVAQVARREGVASLKDDAISLVNEGITSMPEALQIIMSE